MTNHAPVAPSALQISDISIKQDAEGRYCLNDLHKASGSNPKHKPANFLRLSTTSELVTEIYQFSHMRSVETISGGKTPGTYVAKELVYAYAMWISAAFSLKVIRAYDALHSAPVESPKPEPTPLPPQLRTKILFTLDNGVTTQQMVPVGSCVIDPNDLASLNTLIRTEIPFALLPNVLELVAQRLAREYRRLPRLPATTQSV